MANTFNALTTGTGGVATSGDSSGTFAFASNGTTVATISATGVINASAVTGLTTALTVAQGGTGAATLTANNVLLGNGTSAVQAVAPGTSGNVLTSNGTTWTSAAGAVGYAGFSTVVFASSTTWAVPSGITRARITVIGAGGAGRGLSTSSCGGFGGLAVAYCTGISGTLTITVGTTAGATSSVSGTGVSVTATGGAAGGNGANGANGAGSVSTGTALRTNAVGFHYALNGSGSTLNAQGDFTGGRLQDNVGAAWTTSSTAQAGYGGIQNATLWMGGAVIIDY